MVDKANFFVTIPERIIANYRTHSRLIIHGDTDLFPCISDLIEKYKIDILKQIV